MANDVQYNGQLYCFYLQLCIPHRTGSETKLSILRRDMLPSAATDAFLVTWEIDIAPARTDREIKWIHLGLGLLVVAGAALHVY